jgi:hypothetical protein
MTSRCAVGVVSDKYRFGDVGALLDRPKWLRFKPAPTGYGEASGFMHAVEHQKQFISHTRRAGLPKVFEKP